ncbi:RF-1 domain-containing protein [Chytriomyces sp. MP71]|nr:RF-1 domain-containing protein [Chytriomyces sp. MP71]
MMRIAAVRALLPLRPFSTHRPDPHVQPPPNPATSAILKPTPPHLLQRKRPPIALDEKDLLETFIKGSSGKGGQKINKTASCVQLKHVPTGFQVQTQRFRMLGENRKEARKLLSLELDDHFNGAQSKRNRENAEVGDSHYSLHAFAHTSNAIGGR